MLSFDDITDHIEILMTIDLDVWSLRQQVLMFVRTFGSSQQVRLIHKDFRLILKSLL